MGSTNIFNYRHFDVQRDFASLVTLLNEVEQVDHDGEDVSEAMLREQLTWPGHDPALDRWVATPGDSGQLVGYGTMFKSPNDEHADVYIVVHPAWRRRGIGSELLARVLERARLMRVCTPTQSVQGQTPFCSNIASRLSQPIRAWRLLERRLFPRRTCRKALLSAAMIKLVAWMYL